MSKQFDLAIVGAGILGSFAAYHAAQRGLNVILLEAGSTPRGATVRNFGQVVPSGQGLNGWRQFGIRSLEIYKEIAKQFNLTTQAKGSLYVASDEDESTLLEEMSLLDSKMDYNSECWTAQQCMEKIPSLKPSYVRTGLFYPGEINIDSAQFLPKMVDSFSRIAGITYQPCSSITTLEVSSGKVTLKLSDGNSVFAKKTLVCCGHQLNRLLPLADDAPQIKISRLQMLASNPVAPETISGNLLTGLSIRRYEAFHSCPSFNGLKTPEYLKALEAEGIHVLIKQAQNGELIIGDSHQYYSGHESDSLDYHVEERVNQLILDEMKRIVEVPNLSINRTWNGYYSQDDTHGVYAKTFDDNVHVVTGIGGKGMSTGPGFMEKVIKHLVEDKTLDAKQLIKV